eukprot:11159218-Lingulodinium_polyedra.AAC.1
MGAYDVRPEFQVVTPRATQDSAEAWITRLDHAARREGGFLEWRAQILWLGRLSGMNGQGIEPWAARALR